MHLAKRLGQGLLTLLAITFVLTGLAALNPPPAAAAPTTRPAPVAQAALPASLSHSMLPANVVAPDDPGGGRDIGYGTRRIAEEYLPVNRWVGATGMFHRRQSQNWLSADIFDLAQRNIAGAFIMSLGDWIWSGISALTSFAINLDLFEMLGSSMDRFAASIGRALVGMGGSSMILVALIAAFLFYGLWTARRSGGAAALRIIGPKALTVGMLVFMVQGAMATQPGGQFGVGSPGWVLSNTNDVVTRLASAPAAALSMPNDPAGDRGREPFSCVNYTWWLKDQYRDYTEAAEGTRVITDPAAVVPLIMSGMWESTGLEAWKAAQFGRNVYADRSYCRLLEWYSGVEPEQHKLFTQLSVRDLTGTMPAAYDNSIAFNPVDDLDRDMSLVAWASCHQGQRYSNALANPDQDKAGNPDCADWWTKPSKKSVSDRTVESVDANIAVFDWENNPGKIKEKQEQGHITMEGLEYLKLQHGSQTLNTGPAAYSYLGSAILTGVVFGGISIAVVLAKIALMMMMLVAFVIIIASLFPAANTSQRLGQAAKQMLGYMVLAAGGVLIFSLIAVATDAMKDLGMSIFTNEIMQSLWVGLCPLLAALSLHMAFKKLLKMPSPLTPKGAFAYGAAAGGIGGAIGGFGGGFVGNALRGASRRAGAKAMSATTTAIKRRLPGARKGAMNPNEVGSSAVRDKALATALPVGGGAAAAVGAGGAAAKGAAKPGGSDLGLDPAGTTPVAEQRAGQREEENPKGIPLQEAEPVEAPETLEGVAGEDAAGVGGSSAASTATNATAAYARRLAREQRKEEAARAKEALDAERERRVVAVSDDVRRNLDMGEDEEVTKRDLKRRAKQIRAATVAGSYQQFLQKSRAGFDVKHGEGARLRTVRTHAGAIKEFGKDQAIGRAGLMKDAAVEALRTPGKTAVRVAGKTVAYTTLGALGGPAAILAAAGVKRRKELAGAVGSFVRNRRAETYRQVIYDQMQQEMAAREDARRMIDPTEAEEAEVEQAPGRGEETADQVPDMGAGTAGTGAGAPGASVPGSDRPHVSPNVPPRTRTFGAEPGLAGDTTARGSVPRRTPLREKFRSAGAPIDQDAPTDFVPPVDPGTPLERTMEQPPVEGPNL